MSTFTFSVRRRDLAWGVALIVLLTTIWVARSDIADAGGSPPGEGIAVVYVAVGTGFPDSLGVGPGAGASGAPIIILPKDPPIPAASEAELIRLDPRTVIIVGGTAVISAAMEATLIALLPLAVVTRIAGADRYATNAMFSAATFPIEGWASINATAFTSLSPDTDNVTVATTGAYNATDGVLRAPIQLPHGAEILAFEVVAFDFSSLDALTALYRVDSIGGTTAIASVTTTGNGGLQIKNDPTITAGTELVDNHDYTYLILVEGVNSAALLISGAKVHYRLGVSSGS